MAPAEPTAGRWKTWVLDSPADIVLAAPPAPGSAGAAEDERAVRAAVSRRSRAARDAIAAWDGVGEPVSAPWMRKAFELVSARPDEPPAASRAYALLAVAAYDATVATWYYKYRFQRAAPSVVDRISPAGADPSYPSEHAAVAGAASRVLAYLFPEHPARPLEEAATEAAEGRVVAGTNWPSDIAAGLDLGHQVAERVIAYARQDGAGAPCGPPTSPGGRPDFWAPATGAVGTPVLPCAGGWRPWVLASGGQVRPNPPALFGTTQFEDQVNEVVDVKRDLTAERRRAAVYWSAGAGTPQPAGLWNEIAIAYLRSRLPSEPQAERTLALANVALADAAIAAWDAKYTFWAPRPENGVRDFGADPAWKPYVEHTPLSPSYISVGAAYAGAVAEVLTWLFPEDAGEFRDRANVAAAAGLWAGTQWHDDVSAGQQVGREVGRLVVIDRARTDGAPALPPAKK